MLAETGASPTIANTLWQLFPYSASLGFSDGVIYICDEDGDACSPIADSFYTDFFLWFLFYLPVREGAPGFIFGVVPSRRNIGRVVVYNYLLRYALRARLLKVREDWIPLP